MKATLGGSIGSVALAVGLLAACSSGSGGGSPPPVTVGGTVSGLAGSGLVLVLNGVTRLAVSGNGSFTFADSVPAGGTYGIDVLTQPNKPIQICTVSGGNGMAGTTNVATVTVTCTTQALALFAGNLDGSGTVDGVGLAARFNYPQGLSADNAGNLYVADSDNNTIRVITPAGVVSTLAGQPGISGSADGSGVAARFLHPGGIAIDAAGSLYVADTNNVTVRKITPTGVVTTLAGNPGSPSYSDGTGTAAGFSDPRGIAIDSVGNVYVADTDANTIRKITPAGLVTTLAGTPGIVGGTADGAGAAARFSAPWGIAADTAGNLYVTDSGNSTIRKITPAGLVTTLAGEAGASGTVDGIGTASEFSLPKGIAIDPSGNLYVADNSGDAIRKITPAGVVTTLATKLASNAQNSFNDNGVTIGNSGDVYMADSTSTIRKITPAGAVTTLAGTVVVAGSADGSGAAARFNGPFGIATDTAGNVYVADSENQAVRKLTPSGVVTTLTNVVPGFPAGISADTAGNLYVTATSADTSLILKVTPGGVVTTLAGHSGLDTYGDGIGAAAAFFGPLGTATDTAGNVYVADTENQAVRKITPSGVVTTLAGGPTQCFQPPEPCTISPFSSPVGVATDSAGNVYVADQTNNTVDKITPAGVVSTLAGQLGISGSTDGNGVSAQFNNPKGLATDNTGNVYVADFGNSTIRKITPAGVVSTIVGTAGKAGFVAGPLPGVIGYPMNVAIGDNSIFITFYNGVAVVQGISVD
jgi:sugar lactone lactonase YvrE